MSIRRLFARTSMLQSAGKYIRGDQGPRALPFGRQPPFAEKVSNLLLVTFFYLLLRFQLPQDIDLIWDDGVAPEPVIDMDHSDVPLGRVLSYQIIMAAFVFCIFKACEYVDPQSWQPVAPRRLALPTREDMDFDDDHGRAKV